MQTVEEARALLATALASARGTPEPVPLGEALGRTLACDVAMDHDVPPFARATMDGFAVVASDATPGRTLEVVGRVVAGDPEAQAIVPGQALRIMTGAPLPPGATFVVPFEWTKAPPTDLPRGAAAQVCIERVPGRGPNWVQRASVVAAGETVVRAGARLDAAALGALASAGTATVSVMRRPRVAVLSTGSELVPVDTPPGPGLIRNSNSVALAAQVTAAGGEAWPLGIVHDDLPRLREHIRRGLEADILILSGGVSRGDLDLVPGALEAEGVVPGFHRWAVQPGGPLWFGMHGSSPVFGLPGNPAATFVGFELLVRAAVNAFLGRGVRDLPVRRAKFVGDWGRPSPRRRYRPVDLRFGQHGLEAHLRAWRGSGDPFAFVGAAALAILPEHAAPSEHVDVLPLGDATVEATH